MRVIIDLLKSILDKVKTISEGGGGGGYDFIFRFESGDNGVVVVPEKGDLDTATALCESGQAPKVLVYTTYADSYANGSVCFLTLHAECERSDEKEGYNYGDASLTVNVATNITTDTMPGTTTLVLVPDGIGQITWGPGQDSPKYNIWT